MTGSVARAGNDLEAPDAIARGKPDVGRCLQREPAAGKLSVNDLLPRVDARVELGHEHLDRAAEALLERVERADVVAVSVGERDPGDGSAGCTSGVDQVV